MGPHLEEHERSIKFPNSTPDLVAKQIIEETKSIQPAIEEIKQHVSDLEALPISLNTSAITIIPKTQYSKYADINDLEVDPNKILKVTNIYESKVVNNVCYAVQIDSGIFYKTNKFMRDVIEEIKTRSKNGRMPMFSFTIVEKAYYPGDKKGKLNVVRLTDS